MALIEMFAAHTGFVLAEQAYHRVSRKMRRTDFLSYDINYLLDCYRDGTGGIGAGLPYAELARLLGGSWDEFLDTVTRLKVKKVARRFSLAGKPPAELKDLQAHALDRFKEEGRLDRDEAVVRLDDYDAAHKTLRIQRCNYSDGLRSNYAMDMRGSLKMGTADFSLRAILQHKYGRRLPPLSDRRLSNAVGIAAVVFYRTAEGDIVPYLPRRAKPGIWSENIGTTKKLAVFPGGYHCTASGETAWPEGHSSFYEIFTRDICRELYEEVGLAEQDLAWIYPVSLCREFLRGGKPQLFFSGFTKLPPKDIRLRRRSAIQAQKARGRQEIEDEALTAQTPRKLYAQLWAHGTIEAVANMAFAHDCAILAHKSGQFR